MILTDAELAAAAPHRSRTIDIEAFVDLDDVDPIYFDHPYVVMPSGDAEGTQRAYRLLVEVMGRTDRAALGRFVMRTKEHLALIRVRDERLVLTTLLRHDEVRPTDKLPAPTKKDKPDKKQVDAGRRADRDALLRLGPVALRGLLTRSGCEKIVKRKKARARAVEVPEDEDERADAGRRPHGRTRALARGGEVALKP